MTYILIALVGASFIFEYWLLTKIGTLSKENQNLQTALMALSRDLTNNNIKLRSLIILILNNLFKLDK